MTWFDTQYRDPEARQAVIAALNTGGRAHLEATGGDHGYAAFLAKADMLCTLAHGGSHRDLPGYPWRDAYDDNLSPAQALAAAVGELLKPH